MAAKTQNPASFSRFSRVGFGLSPKTNSAAPPSQKSKQGGVDEEWYIPYNGPYEPPREAPRRTRARDSWGDVVLEHVLSDSVASSSNVRKRNDVQHDMHAGNANRVAQKVGSVSGEEERKGTRSRSHSTVSGKTVSSGTVEPSRTSLTSQPRRSTVSSTHRPALSYVSLDASGGVGESPMPQNRPSNAGGSKHRTSLFTFSGQTRKAPLESLTRKLSRPPRPGPDLGIGYTAKLDATKHRRSSSMGSSFNRDAVIRANAAPLRSRHSPTTDDEDYYHSYYSTLIHTPNHMHAAQQPPAGAGLAFPASRSPHPYARVDPKPQVPTQPNLPHLTFTDTSPLSLQPSANADTTRQSTSRPLTGAKKLKNSVSTPDLRAANSLPPRRLPSKPYGFKERWLSPETWCDAMFFPRPRLKLKQDGELEFVGSGRTVSPPGSPLPRGFIDSELGPLDKGKGVASRVLAHSRSLAELPKVYVSEAGSSSIPHDTTKTSAQDYPGLSHKFFSASKPPRPKSFAQDDMSLVPSLARYALQLTYVQYLADHVQCSVLEEGQLLNDQRKVWQAQATNSFQNKLSRNLSRARSKSLTHKGRHQDEPLPSSIDFLATRACLGNQSMMPIVSPSRSQDSSSSRHRSSSRGTFSRGSHSQSNSLSKTLSKSSKSHSQRHSRTDSWGKSALKVAKSAACGLTSADVESEVATETSGLEGALRRGDTKVIRLSDPAHIPVDKDVVIDRAAGPSVSPIPSTSSDVAVGIALSTPTEDVSEPISLPRHPYAQGGLYSYKSYTTSIDSRREMRSDYAGPHPSMTTGQSSMNDVSSRHRNPPQALHPYAQASRDSFFDDARIVQQPRLDSDVPPPAKMWAQWSPGVVREVLPNEIQYSPFISARSTQITNDAKGMGATPANALRPQRSKDSGLGTSEDHTVIAERELLSQRQAGVTTQRSNRQPVQYDVMRPSYLTQSQKTFDPSSSKTASTSAAVQTDQQTISTSEDDLQQAVASSSVTTSASSSSLRPFGSPDDLDRYQDLFYRPTRGKGKEPSDDEPAPVASTSMWEDNIEQSGSRLSALARELSQEFRQMAAEREPESYYSRASMAASQQSSFFRQPVDSGLEFVFEVSRSESPDDAVLPDETCLAPFYPSINIPEDISQSSLQMDPEEDEDETR